MGATAIVTPMNSLVQYNDYTAANTISSAFVRSSAGGSSILASGSSASSCWQIGSGNLGTPSVTDGSSATVWCQVTFGTGCGVHLVMPEADPRISSVEVYTGASGSPIKQGDAVKVGGTDTWVFYGDSTIIGAGSPQWSVKITLPSAVAIEIPFIGLGGFEQTTATLNQSGFSSLPGLIAGRTFDILDNSVHMGPGPGGVKWTRKQKPSSSLTVRLQGVYDDSAFLSIHDALQDSAYADPTLVILDSDILYRRGSVAFGRVSRLDPWKTNGGSPLVDFSFTVENFK